MQIKGGYDCNKRQVYLKRKCQMCKRYRKEQKENLMHLQ